jgi:tRNA pseudouridine38-40 synthase
MRTVKLTLAYDGSDYVGWQRQASGESIQGLIEDALSKIEGSAVVVHGAGRTDAGVHAEGQAASARISSALDDETLARALNANLPPAIRVMDAQTVGGDFHARFSAAAKRYEYRIWIGPAVSPFVNRYVWHVPQPLQMSLLEEATRVIPGEHDFAAFQGSGSATHTTVRRIVSAAWRRSPTEPLVAFEITGEGFLRHMVRSLVGTLVDIGLGRRPVGDMARLLTDPARADVGRTAPACGLFLVGVEYGLSST